MLSKGQKIPTFKLKNQNDQWVSSESFFGKKVLVFFYPKANTPGCTKEVCNLSEGYEQLQSESFHIIGISPDTVASQKKFSDKYALPFQILADTDHQIAEIFGVWQLKKFMGREFMGVVRTSFLFDESGICTHVIDKVNVSAHYSQVLDLIK